MDTTKNITNKIFMNSVKKYGGKTLDIETPIIGVFSEGEYSGKYSVQNRIKGALKEKGYNTHQIIVNREDILEQSYNFPFEIFNSGLSSGFQMIAFNNYIYEICKLNQPDLLLIEIPLGILPVNAWVTNNFGILAFQISNSVSIDIGLMNLYFDHYTDEIIDYMKNLFLHRFSIEKVIFNLLPTSIDWAKVQAERKIKIMDMPGKYLDKVKKRISEKDFYILENEEEFNRMIGNILHLLMENAIIDKI